MAALLLSAARELQAAMRTEGLRSSSASLTRWKAWGSLGMRASTATAVERSSVSPAIALLRSCQAFSVPVMVAKLEEMKTRTASIELAANWIRGWGMVFIAFGTWMRKVSLEDGSFLQRRGRRSCRYCATGAAIKGPSRSRAPVVTTSFFELCQFLHIEDAISAKRLLHL